MTQTFHANIPFAVLDGRRINVANVTTTENLPDGSLQVLTTDGRVMTLTPAEAQQFDAILAKMDVDGVIATYTV